MGWSRHGRWWRVVVWWSAVALGVGVNVAWHHIQDGRGALTAVVSPQLQRWSRHHGPSDPTSPTSAGKLRLVSYRPPLKVPLISLQMAPSTTIGYPYVVADLSSHGLRYGGSSLGLTWSAPGVRTARRDRRPRSAW